MWIQQGNSQRWAIWQERDVYHCFLWRRLIPDGYRVLWWVTTAVWAPHALHPAFETTTMKTYFPDQGLLTRAEKDALWERITTDTEAFLVQQAL